MVLQIENMDLKYTCIQQSVFSIDSKLNSDENRKKKLNYICSIDKFCYRIRRHQKFKH